MEIEIIVFSILIGLIFGIYYFSKENVLKEKSIISVISGIFSVFLTVAILILFNGLWADIVPETAEVSSEVVKSKLILQGFLIRSVYVLALVAGFLFLYFGFYKKGKKYSMVILPYFLGAVIMIARWLVESGKIIVSTYEKLGVYAILTMMIVAISLIIFYIQHKREEMKQVVKEKSEEQKSTGQKF